MLKQQTNHDFGETHSTARASNARQGGAAGHTRACAYLNVPDRAGCVDAGRADQLWVRLAPVKRRQRGAKLGRFVLHGAADEGPWVGCEQHSQRVKRDL